MAETVNPVAATPLPSTTFSSGRHYSNEERPEMRDTMLMDRNMSAPAVDMSAMGGMMGMTSSDAAENNSMEEMNGMMTMKTPTTATTRGSSGGESSTEASTNSNMNDHSTSSDFLERQSSTGSTILVPGDTKLYGRSAQQQVLFEAFDRILEQRAPKRNMEFILVSGASGTGRTRFVQSLRERVEGRGGIFCSGKFSKMDRECAFTAMIRSFADFTQQVVSRGDEAVAELRGRLKESLEIEAFPMLVKMLPAVSIIMGEEFIQQSESMCEATPEQKEAGFIAIRKLMRVISWREQPLVQFLDDIDSAEAIALEKWGYKVADVHNESVVFVATCRSDASPDSDLSKFLRELESSNVTITNIHLENLTKEDTQEMIDDLYQLPPTDSAKLADFAFMRSRGNPFYLSEVLRYLQQDRGELYFNETYGKWYLTVDAGSISMNCNYCHRDGFFQRKLHDLPRDIQKPLMVAACLGPEATIRLIEVALQEDVKDSMSMILKKGLLVYDAKKKTFTFKHDIVKAAAYDLISEEIKPGFHLEIGMRLWKNLRETELQNKVMVVVNQLELGVGLVQDQQEKYDIASLFLLAAQLAAKKSSFHMASDYLRAGMDLLGERHWRDAYDLSLVLFNNAAEVEFTIGNPERADELLEIVQLNARDFSDKLMSYSTKVHMLGSQGRMDEAVKLGIFILGELGVNMPRKLCHSSLLFQMLKIRLKLRRKSPSRIKRMKHMTDSNKLAAMQMLNMLVLNTFLSAPGIFPFVIIKMIELTLSDGLSAISAVGFAGYGMLMAFAGKLEEGTKYGDLSLEILHQFESKSFLPRCHAFVYAFIRPYTSPWSEALEPLKVGHAVGLQTGDTEFATFNGIFHVMFILDIGLEPLTYAYERLQELQDQNMIHGREKQVRVYF